MTSIMRKILNIDPRVIWLICVVLVVYPLLYPVGLPLKVDELTIKYYDAIESLPPGSIVFAIIDVQSGQVGEMGPQCIATLQHLFEKDIKFVQITFFRADCAVIFENAFLSEVDQHDKEYGVDWVNMGYLEGHETAMSAFAYNFLYPVKDAYGNILEDLPLMKEVRSLEDCDLFVNLGVGEWQATLRQFSTPFEIPTIVGSSSLTVPDIMPYVEAGIVFGLTAGLPGSAQYELVRNKPGSAIRSMDALSTVHLFLLGLMIVTNIAYVTMRSKGEKV